MYIMSSLELDQVTVISSCRTQKLSSLCSFVSCRTMGILSIHVCTEYVYMDSIYKLELLQVIISFIAVLFLLLLAATCIFAFLWMSFQSNIVVTVLVFCFLDGTYVTPFAQDTFV